MGNVRNSVAGTEFGKKKVAGVEAIRPASPGQEGYYMSCKAILILWAMRIHFRFLNCRAT